MIPSNILQFKLVDIFIHNEEQAKIIEIENS